MVYSRAVGVIVQFFQLFFFLVSSPWVFLISKVGLIGIYGGQPHLESAFMPHPFRRNEVIHAFWRGVGFRRPPTPSDGSVPCSFHGCVRGFW